MGFVAINMQPPIIVVGFGNNGTRVACWFVEACGVHMMVHNELMDWEPVGDFGRKWLPMNFDEIPPDWDLAERNFNKMVLSEVPEEVRSKPWGFKCATGVAIPNVFHIIIPNVKIVHVVRDPREVSERCKMQWLSEYGGKFVESKIKGIHSRYLSLWSKFNLVCAQYCETFMETNYMQVRLEDLVLMKDGYLDYFKHFLELDVVDTGKIDKLSVDRIKKRVGTGDRSFEYAEEAMRRFGYL